MSKCYCGCLLGVLVIIFAWVNATWASVVLTVIGVLVAVKELGGLCCCAPKKEDAETETPPEV